MIPPALTLFLSRTESRLSFCRAGWLCTSDLLFFRQMLYSWATTREATLLRKVWLNRDKVPAHRRSTPKHCQQNAQLFGTHPGTPSTPCGWDTDDIVTMESSEHHMERNFIILSCGDWIWTNDLLVMSQTRCLCTTPQSTLFWKALKPLKGNRNDNMSLNPCVRIRTVIDDYHHLRYPFQLPFTLLSQGIILFSPDKGRCKPYQTGLPNSRFQQALFSELESNQHLVPESTMALIKSGHCSPWASENKCETFFVREKPHSKTV